MLVLWENERKEEANDFFHRIALTFSRDKLFSLAALHTIYERSMAIILEYCWSVVVFVIVLSILVFSFYSTFFHQEYGLMCCCCFFFFYKNSAKTTTIIIKIRIIFLCSFVGVVDGNNDVVDIDDNDAFNLKWGFFALSFFFLTTRNKKNR